MRGLMPGASNKTRHVTALGRRRRLEGTVLLGALTLALSLALGGVLAPASVQADPLANSYRTAQEFYKLGEWATAERLLQEILSQSPNHHAAGWMLANLYLKTGRAQEARPLIERVAQGAEGEIAKEAQDWLSRHEAAAPEAPFTPDASGSVTLAPPAGGFQEARFPTAPLHLRIPAGYQLVSSRVEKASGVLTATYRFAPDRLRAESLGLEVAITTLERPVESTLNRTLMSRAMLARDGLTRTTPFRERDQVVNGHHARFIGYSNPANPQIQHFTLGVATSKYRVILHSACDAESRAIHLPLLQTTLGSLRLR